MHRFSRRTAFALAAGVVVAACGSDDDTSSTEADDSSPPSDAVDSSTSGPVVATPAGGSVPDGTGSPHGSAYDRDATLRYSSNRGVTTFDAHKSGSSFDNTSLFLVYDRLVHNAPDASAVPGLATSWEFNPDGTTLTFTLRDGVTFQDGTPFDADTVKANIERGQTVEGSAVASDLTLIESVEVIDPLTALFHLNGPAAHLPLLLSDRAGVMISPAAFGNADLDQRPVGAGMFTVTEYQQDALIVFERYENYWDLDAVRLRQLELTVATDSATRLNAIRTGAIDLTAIDAPQESDAEAAELAIVRGSTLQYWHLQLNRSFEPFSKLEVRQAINHAIDRQGIIDALMAGGGTIAGQVFPEGYLAFDPATGNDPYPYDPDRARELLTIAGYGDGFEFESLVSAIPIVQQVAEVLQAQLAQIGITATLTSIDPTQSVELFYVQQKANANVTAWGGRADPSVTLSLLFDDDGFSNPGRHTTPDVQAAVDATMAVQSDQDRQAALQAASAAVTDAALAVPLFFPTSPYAMTDRVLGWQVWLSGKPEFRHVGLRTE